jgi:hypothetical protein
MAFGNHTKGNTLNLELNEKAQAKRNAMTEEEKTASR